MLAEVVMPGQADGNSDTNNGEGFTCDWADPESGDECGEWWPNKFRYGRHRKSHETRPCGKCGREISKNGHTQHERVCRGKPADPEAPVELPWNALQQVFDDYQSLTIEVAPNSVLVLTSTRAAFMTCQAAVAYTAQLAKQGVPAMLIPAVFVQPPEQAKRWRRITPGDTNPTVGPAKNGTPTPVRPLRGGLLDWSS